MFVIVCLGINGLIVHLSHVWLDVEALRLGRLGLSCINVAVLLQVFTQS